MNTLRQDNGDPMTIKQVCGIACDLFGASAILKELAGILAWSSRYESANDCEWMAKDAEAIAMIAERLKRMEERPAKE